MDKIKLPDIQDFKSFVSSTNISTSYPYTNQARLDSLAGGQKHASDKRFHPRNVAVHTNPAIVSQPNRDYVMTESSQHLKKKTNSKSIKFQQVSVGQKHPQLQPGQFLVTDRRRSAQRMAAAPTKAASTPTDFVHGPLQHLSQSFVQRPDAASRHFFDKNQPDSKRKAPTHYEHIQAQRGLLPPNNSKKASENAVCAMPT